MVCTLPASSPLSGSRVTPPGTSTAGYAPEDASAIIIATEAGMLHRLQKECRGKTFIPAPTAHCRCNECRFMKMNTLEKLYDCMVNLAPQIQLSEAVIQRARLPIERMLEISARPEAQARSAGVGA